MLKNGTTKDDQGLRPKWLKRHDPKPPEKFKKKVDLEKLLRDEGGDDD